MVSQNRRNEAIDYLQESSEHQCEMLNPSTWKMKTTSALFLSECLRLKGVCGKITKIAMQCCRATYKLASLFHSQLPASIASNLLPGLCLDATNLDFFSSFLAVFMEIIDDKQDEMICTRERLLEPCLVISFIKVFVKLLSNYLRFIYLCVTSAAVAPGISLSLSLWAKESSLIMVSYLSSSDASGLTEVSLAASLRPQFVA
ncbi:hypothetical protein RHSIM_Rhsim09G0184900 [Rhododendron simsii]|uniref:Uncharacterized protein n=1 Tax=Rhododendron simsii TaxID=118357 RepID=A0A834GEC4_RHOSS|nr:hypothetical protein RHSIM_Rhsim09G0184900 [Rhododendron simsii]